MPDPFNNLYTQISTKLAAFTPVTDLISSGNIIDFNERRKPTKSGITTADLPELMFYMSAVRGNIHASSSDVYLTTVWQFTVSTGTFYVTTAQALMFYIIQFATNWKDQLRPVTWESKTFVKDVRLVNQDLGVSNPELNRNIRGWASVIQLEIDVALDIADVQGSGLFS